jgi:hypothetical protein
VLYRFDDAARFPVFESHTTAKGTVAIHVDREEVGDFLRIDYQRHEADPDEVDIVLALPLVAVGCCRSAAEARAEVAVKRQLLLDVFGDASCCHLYLEGMDASGSLLALSFGPVDFTGWHTLRADASKLVSPVQFHRFRLTTAPSSHAVRLGVRSLSLTGEVRVAAAGMT